MLQKQNIPDLFIKLIYETKDKLLKRWSLSDKIQKKLRFLLWKAITKNIIFTKF